MLYMLDEYLRENSKITPKNMQGLKKFQDAPKYLHKMEVEELNGAVKKWNFTTKAVADRYRREIKRYLKWLESKGIQTNLNIVDKIEFPIADKQFLVYSTDDIAHYYGLFFEALENHQSRKTTINKGSFLMSWASGILAFHGLTPEQIFNLDLEDVTADGVKGYSLPLSKKDIDVLLQYKALKVMSNNLPLIGNKYIRLAVNSKNEVEPRHLSTPVWRSHLNDKDNYLKGILRVANLYQLGIYNRLYEYEKANGVSIQINQTTPEWFIQIGRLENRSPNAIVDARKDYMTYREERDEHQRTEGLAEQSSKNDYVSETPNRIFVDEKIGSGRKIAIQESVDVQSKINNELCLIMRDLDALRARVQQMQSELNDMFGEIIK